MKISTRELYNIFFPAVLVAIASSKKAGCSLSLQGPPRLQGFLPLTADYGGARTKDLKGDNNAGHRGRTRAWAVNAWTMWPLQNAYKEGALQACPPSNLILNHQNLARFLLPSRSPASTYSHKFSTLTHIQYVDVHSQEGLSLVQRDTPMAEPRNGWTR